MATSKDGDTLSEIRHEYKEKKKQLEKYTTFIDRHPWLIVFTPMLLISVVMLVVFGTTSSTASEQSSGNMAAGIAALVSMALLVVVVVLVFITSSRKSARAKIDKQLEALKNEATLFQKQAKDHDNVSRDELGLWRDIEQGRDDNANSGKGGWVLGVIVIVVVASVISFNQANQRDQEAAERTRQSQIIEQQRVRQQQDDLEQRKLEQQDEANRLQRQQNATNLYNSTKPSSNDNYRSNTSCTSRAIGSSVYTDCY